MTLKQVTNYQIKFGNETISTYTGSMYVMDKICNVKNPRPSKKKISVPNGKGQILHLKTGIIYQGDFVDGKYHGIGKLITKKKGDITKIYSIYTGEFNKGTYHGKGCIEFFGEDILKLDGNWIHNSFETKGSIIYKSGNKYIGQIKNFKRHGEGLFYFSSNSCAELNFYHGEWVNDQMHGPGIILTKDGREVLGVWNSNKLICTVIIKYKSGDKYIGGCDKNYQPEGSGIYVKANGNYYSCDKWVNGLKNGMGLFYSKFGSYVIRYEWIDDVTIYQHGTYHY